VTPDSSPLASALAGRYIIERELGAGGMATVYLARDLRHDRPVALKVLKPELAATLGPERFQREIRIAARLQHRTSRCSTASPSGRSINSSPCSGPRTISRPAGSGSIRPSIRSGTSRDSG
jgi:serine/threonine protein kinase